MSVSIFSNGVWANKNVAGWISLKLKSVFAAVLPVLFLSGCFESENALFPDADMATGILAARYTVTDGKKPIGKLELVERRGELTVLASTDVSATAKIAEGRKFKLFPASLEPHPYLRSFGAFEYYWVQAEKENSPGFDYDLIAVSTRKERFVFRWTAWLFNDNEDFTNSIFALAEAHPDLLTCLTEKNGSCSFKDRGVFDEVAKLIVEHELNPSRAYVPR